MKGFLEQAGYPAHAVAPWGAAAKLPGPGDRSGPVDVCSEHQEILGRDRHHELKCTLAAGLRFKKATWLRNSVSTHKVSESDR